MKKIIKHNYLANFAEKKLSEGKYCFTFNELKKEFPEHSNSALVFSLNRLVQKRKIVSIHRNFYLIIPPERMSKGILPPQMFIDDLMRFLEREYYVGLLSAATYFGASHQQAQEFFAFIQKPSLRNKNKRGIKINFMIKNNWPKVGIEKKKSETGFFYVSSAELTAIDLIKYQSKIGGINRAIAIIYELAEAIKPTKLKFVIESNNFGIATLQRFGYILEKLNLSRLSNIVSKHIENKKIFNVPLKSDAPKNGFPINKKWHIIENINFDFEF